MVPYSSPLTWGKDQPGSMCQSQSGWKLLRILFLLEVKLQCLELTAIIQTHGLVSLGTRAPKVLGKPNDNQ